MNPRRRKIRADWRRTNVKQHNHYIGTVHCSRCGLKGYLQRRTPRHVKMEVNYPSFLVVYHHHTENGKTVYDGNCYLGKNF